jgi:hypothetical protein
MKAKSLSFVFIYFSESGLFKGLHAIQIEKSFAMSHSVSNVTTASPILSARQDIARKSARSGD